MVAEENIFGNICGRFDEVMARRAGDDTIDRIVWGFASLGAAEGMVLVPGEPTQAFKDAAWNALLSRGVRHFGMGDIEAVYRAALATRHEKE